MAQGLGFVRMKNSKRKYKRSLGFESLESRRLMAGLVMTNQEQLLVELVNRARSNPVAEAARFSIDLNAGHATG